MNESNYSVLWPLARKHVTQRSAAPRVASLSQAVVAEVWDYLFKGDEMFRHLRNRLRERHPSIEFVDYAAFGNIHGPDQRRTVANLAAELRERGCTAVILAVAA